MSEIVSIESKFLLECQKFDSKLLYIRSVNGKRCICTTDNKRNLPYKKENEDFVKGLFRCSPKSFYKFEDQAFVQLADFYLFDRGQLSKYVNYDRLLPCSVCSVRPREVSFVLTKRCNFHCLHCYNDSGSRTKKELDSNTKLEVVDYLGRWGIRILALTGGEPTLDPSFPEILDRAACYKLGVKISTNGWQPPPVLFDYISNGVVFQINVSLDGANKDTHDYLRQKHGSYDRVLRFLLMLRRAQLKYLIINSAIYKKSLAQMEEILFLALKHGASVISFKPITHSGRNRRIGADNLLLENQDLIKFKQERDRLREIYGSDIHIDGRLIGEGIPDYIKEFVSCSAGRKSMTILEDGQMMPCETLSNDLPGPIFQCVPPAIAWREHENFRNFRSIVSIVSGDLIQEFPPIRGCIGRNINKLYNGPMKT